MRTRFDAADPGDPDLEAVFRALARNAGRWTVAARAAGMTHLADQIGAVDPTAAEICRQILAQARQGSGRVPPRRARLWWWREKLRVAWGVMRLRPPAETGAG